MKFGNRCLFLLLILVLCFTACRQEVEEKTVVLKTAFPEWAKNASIYEVNVRQHTPEGTFKAFQEGHLKRIHEMGADILWLMPIFPISEAKRKGSLGSYYAVSDFRKTNPEFGTMEDFKSLLAAAHGLGMKIILDWVPNHTGWDHVWIQEHPDYFTQVADTITDPINPETGESWGWTDVADLNYDNPKMREEMISDLLFWVNEVGVDGYRMDVAHGVPLDFWQQAIPQLRAAKSDIFMLAEAEIPEQVNSDSLFTMCYGWSFHHILNHIAQEKDSLISIDRWLKEKSEKINKEAYLMHFVTNHDENSWAGTELERMGKAVDAMTVLAFTFDGMPLVYSGQEEPLTRRLLFFEKDSIDWGNYEKEALLTTLLKLKDRNQAIWNGMYGGELRRIPTSNDQKIYAFLREKQGNRVLVILNLSAEPQQSTLKCDNCAGAYKDIFTGKAQEITDGYQIKLGAWAYQVLEI